jgi:hypothetical protein
MRGLVYFASGVTETVLRSAAAGWKKRGKKRGALSQAEKACSLEEGEE